MTDYRALCAELEDAYTWCIEEYMTAPAEEDTLIQRARAALAQPEPVAPTDEALANFSGWFCRNYPGPDTIIHKPEWHAPKVFRAAADAIARYARPTIQPVPVSERPWERKGWYDAEGQCWMGHPGGAGFIPSWRLCRPEDAPSMTCSLPHNALPTPEATDDQQRPRPAPC